MWNGKMQSKYLHIITIYKQSPGLWTKLPSQFWAIRSLCTMWMRPMVHKRNIAKLDHFCAILYVHLVEHKTKHTPNSCVKLESLTIPFQEIQLFPISNLLKPSGVVRYWHHVKVEVRSPKMKKQLFLGMAITSPRFAEQLAWTNGWISGMEMVQSKF